MTNRLLRFVTPSGRRGKPRRPNSLREFVEPEGSSTHLSPPNPQSKTDPVGSVLLWGFGGERGIRTLDGLLTHTPLAGECLQPLGHLSVAQRILGRSGRVKERRAQECRTRGRGLTPALVESLKVWDCGNQHAGVAEGDWERRSGRAWDLSDQSLDTDAWYRMINSARVTSPGWRGLRCLPAGCAGRSLRGAPRLPWAH